MPQHCVALGYGDSERQSSAVRRIKTTMISPHKFNDNSSGESAATTCLAESRCYERKMEMITAKDMKRRVRFPSPTPVERKRTRVFILCQMLSSRRLLTSCIDSLTKLCILRKLFPL